MLSWKLHCSHKPVFHCILVEVLLLTTKILLAASMTPFQSAPFTVTIPNWMSSFCNNNVTLNTITYYINTNAIPGELLQENMISSHVKMTCYLTHCSEKVWYFVGVHIINKHYMATWRYKISLQVLKNISLVCCAHSWNIFQHSKRNFVSSSGHVISSISLISCYPCSDKCSLQEGWLLDRGLHSVSSCVSDTHLACRKTPSLFFFPVDIFLCCPHNLNWTPGTRLVSFSQFYQLGLRYMPTVKKGDQ